MTMPVKELRRNLADTLNRVCFGNEEIIVARRGREIARIIPVKRKMASRAGVETETASAAPQVESR